MKLFKPACIASLLLSLTLGAGAANATLADIADALKALPKTQSVQDNPVLPRHDFTVLVKQAGPAVVNISSERTTQVRQRAFRPFGEDFFRGSPFEDEFNDFFAPFGGPMAPAPQQRKQTSLGSGFIISPDGYIVTNNHVVDRAESITVNFGDPNGGSEQSYQAEIIGTDKETDLALLKIKVDQALPFISFGDSNAIEVGEWVLAIGNPFGLDHTVTAGILSAKFRNIDSRSLVRFLQTDASINPGNSGGPLLNMKGEVIGINTAIAAQGQGIGFAIPSTLASKIIDDLKSARKVSRGWLGVTIQNVDQATAKALGLPKASGALIGGLLPDQPAAKAGMKAGDVVLKVNGKEIATSDELMRTISSMRPGDSVTLIIWRDGAEKELRLELAERNPQALAKEEENGEPAGSAQAQKMDALGLQLRPLSEAEASRLGLDPAKGGLLIVRLEPGKLAAEAGLNRGDIILGVGQTPVKSAEEFQRLAQEMSAKQGALMLQLFRNGQQFIRSIEIPKK